MDINYKEILITAIITFIFSGIGGAYLQSCITKAKPIVTISSIGFEGNKVELSDKTLDLKKKTILAPSLKKYINFSSLLDEEHSISKMIELLKNKARNELSNWIEKNGDKKINEKNLLKSPFLKYHQLQRLIMSKIFDGEKINWPIKENLTKENIIFSGAYIEAKENDDFLYFSTNQNISSHYLSKNLTNDFEIEVLIESFSRGISENLFFLHRWLSDMLASEIIALEEYRDHIRKDLAWQSHLSASVTISNIGNSPIIINPYFSLKTKYDKKYDIFYMRPKDSFFSIASLPNMIKEIKKLTDALKFRDYGEMVNTERYLPKLNSSPYISIAGGETEEITLISLKTFGDRSKKIIEYYNLGILECALTALSIDNKKIFSKVSLFGSDMNDKIKKQLAQD